MARTRGASDAHRPGVIHMDDGEIVAPVIAAPVVEPVAPVSYAYVTDTTTWQRSMGGWEALHLLNLMMGGGLSATLTAEEFAKLPADVRFHFRRQVVER